MPQPKEYTCTLHVVEYVEDESIPVARRMPVHMTGDFAYRDGTLMHFQALFEPMSGMWIWETNADGKKLSNTVMRDDPRFYDIEEAAMRVACENRTAVHPQDFKWTYTKKVVEEWA